MRLRQLSIVFMLISLVSCSDLGQAPEPLSANADGLHIYLTNTTQDTLYYFMCLTALVPVIDWIPCDDPGSCPDRVLPHRTVSIAYPDFWWMKTERSYDKVTIYWWRLVKQPGGTYRSDQMHSVEALIM